MNKDEKSFQTEKEIKNSDQNTEVEVSKVEEIKKTDSKEKRDQEEIESKAVVEENTDSSTQNEPLLADESNRTHQENNEVTESDEPAPKEDSKEIPVKSAAESAENEDSEAEKVDGAEKSAIESEFAATEKRDTADSIEPEIEENAAFILAVNRNRVALEEFLDIERYMEQLPVVEVLREAGE